MSICIEDSELPRELIANLQKCDDPANELDIVLDDLENYVDGLCSLRRESKYLMTATLQRPEETGDDELDKAAEDEWDKSPRRYVLPVSIALKGRPQH